MQGNFKYQSKEILIPCPLLLTVGIEILDLYKRTQERQRRVI